MDSSEFINPAGGLISATSNSLGEYIAFLPYSLPIELILDNETADLLAKASYSLGNLERLIRQLPNPALLVRPFATREIASSSRIEGTRVSVNELMKIEMEGGMKGNDPSDISKLHVNFTKDIIEALTSREAFDYSINYIKSHEITKEMILQMHARMFQYEEKYKEEVGKFRRMQNWIGPENSRINEARFVPPPPAYVDELMANLIHYINSNDSTNLIVKIALVHYQFEAIHPFWDGNGRIGRLLLLLTIIKSNLISEPVLYISEYFEKNKPEYSSIMLDISKKSDYLVWVKFFAKALDIQAKENITTITGLLKYLEETTSYLERKGVNGFTISVFKSLQSNPFVRISEIKRTMNTNYPRAKRAVLKLVELGILKLEKDEGKTYNQYYSANAILGLISPESYSNTEITK